MLVYARICSLTLTMSHGREQLRADTQYARAHRAYIEWVSQLRTCQRKAHTFFLRALWDFDAVYVELLPPGAKETTIVRFECHKRFPVTQFPVLLVSPSKDCPLPELDQKLYALKAFDPRFSPQLRESKSIGPWSDNLADALEYTKDAPDAPSDDEDADDPPYQCEQAVAIRVQECLDNELSVYQHLLDLQGLAIPRMYARGKLACSRPLDLFERGRPAIILLEFIEGSHVQDLPGGPSLEICRSVMAAISNLAVRDFVNSDVRLDNILIRPDGTVCFFNFGQARMREDDEDAAEWWYQKINVEEEERLSIALRIRFGYLHRRTNDWPRETRCPTSFRTLD